AAAHKQLPCAESSGLMTLGDLRQPGNDPALTATRGKKRMDSITRRSFLEKAGVSGISLGTIAERRESKRASATEAGAKHSAPPALTRYAVARSVAEWAYSSGKAYADPFNEVELDVVFTDLQGREQRVPAFWAGE